MRMKEESEKAGLKLNIQKMKIMLSGPSTSWQTDEGKKWKQWQTLFSWAPKITADSDCSHEIQRHLLLGRIAMVNIDSILKNRDVTLVTKVHIVKAVVFPVVMYCCENWTIMKAECQRIDAFELWFWRGLLRVPWAARRSNWSILKEINSEHSLERLMLTLKLHSFGHLMRRTNSLEKTLMLQRLRAKGEGADKWWGG